jgi:hypothetical protein
MREREGSFNFTAKLGGSFLKLGIAAPNGTVAFLGSGRSLAYSITLSARSKML